MRISTFTCPCHERKGRHAGNHSLAVEAFGKAWLFTLGPQSQASPGGTKVTEVGPLPEVRAPQYLLRVNEGSGVPGSVTSVHTHPGSEAYYVLSGEAAQKTPHGVGRIPAGQSLAGHGADTVMQFLNSGTTDVRYFALFVVDATKPLDGVEMPDRYGLELPGLPEARTTAIEAAGEMLKDSARKLPAGSGWRLWVTDEAGGTVCELRFSMACL